MRMEEERPIFLQLADQLEDGILSGAYTEDGQVPSITEFSVAGKINPATALKGINRLVEDGLLYKKRRVGMFVSPGARETLRQRRRERFFEEYIRRAVSEARRLELTDGEILAMMKRGLSDVD